MSRLTDLIAKAKAEDPQLGADLERGFEVFISSPLRDLGLLSRRRNSDD